MLWGSRLPRLLTPGLISRLGWGWPHFLVEHPGEVGSIPIQPGPRPFPGLPA